MNDWISVKDKLPKKHISVLIYRVYGKDDFYKGIEIGFYEDFWQNDESLSVEKVTHWMPLPAPPNDPQ